MRSKLTERSERKFMTELILRSGSDEGSKTVQAKLTERSERKFITELTLRSGSDEGSKNKVDLGASVNGIPHFFSIGG